MSPTLSCACCTLLWPLAPLPIRSQQPLPTVSILPSTRLRHSRCASIFASALSFACLRILTAQEDTQHHPFFIFMCVHIAHAGRTSSLARMSRHNNIISHARSVSVEPRVTFTDHASFIGGHYKAGSMCWQCSLGVGERACATSVTVTLRPIHNITYSNSDQLDLRIPCTRLIVQTHATSLQYVVT